MPTAREVHEALLGLSVKSLYQGSCLGCGECCSRFLSLSEPDKARLLAYVLQHGIEQTPERAEVDLRCPYLTDERTCAVYDARPAICRAYRCDQHANGDFSGVKAHMASSRYTVEDMREVARHA